MLIIKCITLSLLVLPPFVLQKLPHTFAKGCPDFHRFAKKFLFNLVLSLNGSSGLRQHLVKSLSDFSVLAWKDLFVKLRGFFRR